MPEAHRTHVRQVDIFGWVWSCSCESVSYGGYMWMGDAERAAQRHLDEHSFDGSQTDG